MVVRPLAWNAQSPIVSSAEPASKVTDVRAEQDANAKYGMAITEAATNRLPSTTLLQLRGAVVGAGAGAAVGRQSIVSTATEPEYEAFAGMVMPPIFGELSNALAAMVTALDEQLNSTDVSSPHELNASSAMIFSEAGSAMVVRPLLLNARSPIVSSAEPATKVTDVRAEQDANARSAILLTEAGTAMVVRPLLLNALSPIVSSAEPASKVTDVRAEQPSNARSVIPLTEAGTVMVVRPLPRNAP
jgi:hypothetical protein